MTTRNLYIFDLDGTLALHHHRLHFIAPEGGKKDWDAFNAACVDDEPNVSVIDLMSALLSDGAEVWVWTGRSRVVWDETVEWLAGYTGLRPHNLECGDLRMRDEHDRRPDYMVKREWLDSLPLDQRERLVAVFEDRDRVVEMWRTAGVPCFQVARGDF